MKLPKLSSGKYTIANEGTQVFTKEQTDNLYELSKEEPRKNYVKIEPEEYIESLRKSHGNGMSVNAMDFAALAVSPTTVNAMEKVIRDAKIAESIIDKSVHNTPTVNMHYDSMYRFEGDVNDIKHLTEQLTKIADKSSMKAADNAIRKLAGGIRH